MAVDVTPLFQIINDDEPDVSPPVTRDLLGSSNSNLALSKNLGINESGRVVVHHHHQHVQDLNFPPPSLELGVSPPPPPRPPDLVSSGNLSVCTLDKVKLALERAKAGSHRNSELEKSWCSNKEEGESSKSSIEEEVSLTGPMLAAGCPECLFYVLVSPENPTCPRCSALVPCPLKKKRRLEFDFDLNSS